jgi:hypothetical protein
MPAVSVSSTPTLPPSSLAIDRRIGEESDVLESPRLEEKGLGSGALDASWSTLWSEGRVSPAAAGRRTAALVASASKPPLGPTYRLLAAAMSLVSVRLWPEIDQRPFRMYQ